MRVVVLPPLQQVVGRDVRLVADRHERRKAEVAAGRRLEQRKPERAALRREADVAGRNRFRRERCVQPRRVRRDPETVRPEQARAVGAHEREELLLPRAPLRAELGKAGRDDAERADAGAQRFLRGREHVLARQAEDGQVDLVGNLRDRGVGAHPADRLGVPVHGIGGAGELAGEHVAEELAADRPPARGGADDGNRARLEERTQRRDDGDVVARVDGGDVVACRRDREGDLDGAVRDLPLDLEAGSGEDLQHRDVAGQHLGDEAFDPGLARQCGEPLQQPRPDAEPLRVVGHRERGLRGVRVAETHPVSERDDRAVGDADQRAALDEVRIDDSVGEPLVHGDRSVKAVVEALTRERAEEVRERGNVLARRRPEPQRAPVSKDDVDRGGRAGRLGSRRPTLHVARRLHQRVPRGAAARSRASRLRAPP